MNQVEDVAVADNVEGKVAVEVDVGSMQMDVEAVAVVV